MDNFVKNNWNVAKKKKMKVEKWNRTRGRERENYLHPVLDFNESHREIENCLHNISN